MEAGIVRVGMREPAEQNFFEFWNERLDEAAPVVFKALTWGRWSVSHGVAVVSTMASVATIDALVFKGPSFESQVLLPGLSIAASLAAIVTADSQETVRRVLPTALSLFFLPVIVGAK